MNFIYRKRMPKDSITQTTISNAAKCLDEELMSLNMF